MLNGWRVLDLTDERGEVGPYLLADLGAEVIKVEPAGGCPSRARGHDEIPFHAYNGNKASIELPGTADDDRRIVAELVAGADLVFDSGPPGRLTELGLGRDGVAAANDRVVVVTVTPFGLTGPRADQPATELTIAALGGPMWMQGTRDRAPVKMSVPQVWRHAGAEAAIAALVAHNRMLATGGAQFVDVSAQSVMTWTLLNAMEAFEIQGRDFERNGSALRLTIDVQLRLDAADGYVVAIPTGRSVRFLLPWLLEEGIVGSEWAETDWELFDHAAISGEPTAQTLTEVTEAVYELCRRYPKWELFRRGLTLGASLAPLNTLADLLAFDHLDVRSFWTPDGESRRAPGAYLRIDGERPAVRRGRAALGDATSRWSDRATPQGQLSAPSSNGQAAPLPLDGVKVVDFSWIGVGPMTAKALADHGATVVRIESENRLDGLRQQPPYKDDQPGLNRSNFFGTFNTSKRSLGIDLKTDGGIDVARRLIGWADVVIESFTPGTIERLGLGYEAMVVDNPSLIMASTSLLGAGSDVSMMAGYGYHAAALAGFQDLVGWPDLPPDGPWLAYTDTIGPRFITSAVLAALDRRRRTGEGCHIEAAQLEVALQLLAPELVEHERTGEPLRRKGNRDDHIAPQGVYPVSGDDRWLAISVVDDEAWARMVDVLGSPSWATDPALAIVAGREAHHDVIDEHLTAWTAERDGPATERLLASSGIAADMVQPSELLCRDPQYLHRRFYRYLEHSELGTVPYAGHQYRIEGYDHGPRTAAPCLGEHTYEILTEICGLTPDEIATLAADDAFV